MELEADYEIIRAFFSQKCIVLLQIRKKQFNFKPKEEGKWTRQQNERS